MMSRTALLLFALALFAALPACAQDKSDPSALALYKGMVQAGWPMQPGN